MNKDQIKGKIKEVAGEIQEQTGKAIGNKEQQAKGHSREMEGKIQQTAGNIQEAVKDATKR
jgi:uncharacterized protein YjbJ (UPF0337 family)